MEKNGNIDEFNTPPPPYGYYQNNMAPAGGPPDSEYDPNCQKVPLHQMQNPGYPAAGPQGPYGAQQPMGYGQQQMGYGQQHQVVYGQQPTGYGQQQQAVVFVQPQILANPPQDHLGYSIFVTICCCWMIGLFAIIRSAECRSAIAVGDRGTAEAKSRQARTLANVALGLGIVSIVVSVVIFGIYYGMLVSQLQN